jgi:hypothetical protein
LPRLKFSSDLTSRPLSSWLQLLDDEGWRDTSRGFNMFGVCSSFRGWAEFKKKRKVSQSTAKLSLQVWIHELETSMVLNL